MPDYLFYQGEDESFPEVVREEIVATAEVKFSDCEYRNGNIFKQYCWAQTHSELGKYVTAWVLHFPCCHRLITVFKCKLMSYFPRCPSL